MEINEPQLDVRTLAAQLEASAVEAAAKEFQTSSDQRSGNRTVSNGGRPFGARFLQPAFEPRDDDHYNVNELLGYHGASFIQNAYRAILKRGPDVTGFESFREGLESGRLNKIDVLARLRYSREGRKKKVRVDGLFAPAALRQSYRVPVIGYLIQLLVAIVRLPNSAKQRQQFEAHMLAQLERIADFANDGLRRANEESAELSGRMSTMSLEHDRQVRELMEHERQVRESTENERERQVREAIERERQIREQLGILRELIEAESRRRIEDKSEVTLLNLRLQRFMEGKTPEAAAARRPGIESAHPSADANPLDSLYVALEERFRGSEQQIRDRLRVYIDPIREAGAVTDESPLLDVGSGRGEWLKLLRDESLPARGVELNALLAMQSRKEGLSVDEGDAIEFLKQCREQSFGAVTGLHIVEHLELTAVIRLIDEALRSLKPGGLLIFETPNPENVLVGSCNFYFDPTHRNPIPPPVLQFFLETRGFSDVRILRLNPSDDQPLKGDSELVQRFNRLFYGPMDYAVIGRKSISTP